MHVLQPDLILKKNKKLSEIDYINVLSEMRIEYFKKHILILKEYLNSCQHTEKSDYIKYLDLTDVFNDVDDVIFFDKAHITDKGYKILSEKISKELQG